MQEKKYMDAKEAAVYMGFKLRVINRKLKSGLTVTRMVAPSAFYSTVRIARIPYSSWTPKGPMMFLKDDIDEHFERMKRNKPKERPGNRLNINLNS